MELDGRTTDRDQLVRGALAGVLAAVAIRSLRKGKRSNAALSGALALLLGYSVVTGSGYPPETLEPERPREGEELRCAHCGQPIRLGERRGPNAEDQIVHDACLDA